MEIVWNTDVDAPGCPGEILSEDTGKSILIQTDWDYPSTAGTFGWSMQSVQNDGGECDHNETDGTVDCAVCGVTASRFIEAAREWLEDNDGSTAEDPGYFEE